MTIEQQQQELDRQVRTALGDLMMAQLTLQVQLKAALAANAELAQKVPSE